MIDLQQEIRRLPDEVIYGAGAVEQVPRLVEELRAQRVLLVCGRRSFEASGAAGMLSDLRSAAAVDRWSDFSPNTDAADLERGLEVLRATRPDLVLGIGGGSAMDMAKLLCAFQHTAFQQVTDAIPAAGRIDQRDPTLVLVPTTSGSGSEATHFAVVYVGHEKFSIAGPAMLPDRVVLDPELSRSGTAYQRATSGIDAVCQAIESLWATNATAESRVDARRSLDLGLDNLEAFVHDPTSTAAEGMALASHLAGRAINISKTTAPHALSYGITKRHGISHGHAVAMTLGAFLEAHAQADDAELQPDVDPDAHRAVMHEILRALGATDGPSARGRFVALLDRIGLEPHLAAAGISDRGEIGVLADNVNLERLSNNPVRFDRSTLRGILERAD